ncbi:MAG: ArsR family transcriptional regulator [Candidatus Hodarchaeales archaeon]|jgi:DNA-binding transcriptional ArsR family regulator
MENEYSNVISEFSNPTRLKLIKIISDKPSTFTELSKNFDLSNSEVSRHLTRLTEYGFIQKRMNSKKYELSPLGETTLLIFQPLDFLFKNLDYFRTHLVTDLPSSFLKEIDVLNEAEFISTVGQVMIKIEEMVNKTEKSELVMTEEPFPFGKPGLNVKYIVPFKMMELRNSIEDVNRSTDARLLPKIPIGMLISDKTMGIIFFPNLKGEPDFNSGFYLEKESNPNGFSWLIKIWNHFWNEGKIPKIS